MSNHQPTARFSWIHFPIGTVVEVDCMNRKFTGVVHELAQNGAHSFVLGLSPRHADTVNEWINIDWITHVLQRGPGVARVSNERFEGWRQSFWRDYARDVPRKSKGVYVTYSPDELLHYLTYDAQNPCGVDTHKLLALLRAQGVITALPSEGYFTPWTANKRRLRRAIRQNLNRCLVPWRESLRMEIEDSHRQMEDEWDRDFDQREQENADALESTSVFD